MNRDEIISMAREAGIRISSPMDTLSPNNVYPHELHRFADLIAAAEREKVISVVYGQCDNDNVAQRTVDAIRKLKEKNT